MVVQAKVVASVNCTVQPVQRLGDLPRPMLQFLSWIGGRPFLAKTEVIIRFFKLTPLKSGISKSENF